MELRGTTIQLKLVTAIKFVTVCMYFHHANFIKVVDREDRVAFIGISNWALDPAKMNRGIMVTRCDPNEGELEISAK